MLASLVYYLLGLFYARFVVISIYLLGIIVVVISTFSLDIMVIVIIYFAQFVEVITL